MADYTVILKWRHPDDIPTAIGQLKAVVSSYYGSVLETTEDPLMFRVETTQPGAEFLATRVYVSAVHPQPGETVLTLQVKKRPETFHTAPWIRHLRGVKLLETQNDISTLQVDTKKTTLTGLRDYLDEAGYDILNNSD